MGSEMKPKTDYTIEEVEEIVEDVKWFNLNVPSNFRSMPIEAKTIVWNGAGSDTMPDWVRHTLTHILWLFVPAYIIHDIDFYNQQNKIINYESWEKVERRMMYNINKIIEKSDLSLWDKCYWNTNKLVARSLINIYGKRWES